MSDFSGDPAHPASPIRREQARRDGDIPKSFELANALHLLGALAAAYILVKGISSGIRTWTMGRWQEAGSSLEVNRELMTANLQSTVFSFVAIVAPLLALMFFLGVLSHWGQTGIVFRPQQLRPDPTRLGPRRWWSHLFSTRSISIPLIGLPKTLVAGLAAIASAWFQREQVFGLSALPIEKFVEQLFGLILAVGFHVAVVLLVLSLADYGLKRWSFERRIRMTEQQLRDELRMQNGDPSVVNRRRQIHRSYVRDV